MVGDLLHLAWAILRQPNVWVAFALLGVGLTTQASRAAKRLGWSPDRLSAGRLAAVFLSLALAVTLARVTPGLSLRWRGCTPGWGLPIDSAEGLLNVLMLLPAGIAAGYAVRRFWPVAVAGLGVSLLVEAAQGLLGNGSCQGDDIVRNLVGVVAGALVGVAWADLYGRPSHPLTDR